MITLRRAGDVQPVTLPPHLNLSGQSIAMINVPPVDEINWWWTCCNTYNPRETDSHYSSSDISRAHKVGACPEISQADKTMMQNMRSRSCLPFSPPTKMPIEAVLPPRPASVLPPLTPARQLGRKAGNSRRSQRKMRGPNGQWDREGLIAGPAGPLIRSKTMPLPRGGYHATRGVPQLIHDTSRRTCLSVPRNFELQTGLF